MNNVNAGQTYIKKLLYLSRPFIVQVKDVVRILNCLLVWHLVTFLIPLQDNSIIIENNVSLEPRVVFQAIDQFVYFVCMLRLCSSKIPERK